MVILLYHDTSAILLFSNNKINVSCESFFTTMWISKIFRTGVNSTKRKLKQLYFLNYNFLYRRAWINFSLSRSTRDVTAIYRPILDLRYIGKFDFPIASILFKSLINDLLISSGALISHASQLIHKNNATYIKFGMFHYKKFLTLNYHAISYAAFTVFNKFNHLKARIDNVKSRAADFLGFKIKCVGRFSRRQRSSSYWFSLGSVPLNKVSAFILYASHSVILANSTITIKVWVQKACPSIYLLNDAVYKF